MGGRRRGVRRRPTAARGDPRPRPGICAGHRRQPASAHPRGPTARRCAAGVDPDLRLAETFRRRRSARTTPVLVGLVSPAGRRRHRHRNPPFADPPQRCHRRTGLSTLLQPHASTPAHPRGGGRAALAHRRILPSRQRTGRPRPAPGSALDILVPLDHPGHARPCLPGRGHRDRTRHPTDPERIDYVDGQRVSPTLRRPAAGHQPHHGHPAGLVTMATTTPIPSPTFPLPTTPESMIPIYGCSTRPRTAAARSLAAMLANPNVFILMPSTFLSVSAGSIF